MCFGGDLLNQCIGTSFGLRSFHIPFYGLYGACSTMGESLALGAMLIDGALPPSSPPSPPPTSAPPSGSTGCLCPTATSAPPPPSGPPPLPAAAILGAQGVGPYVTHVTCGRIVDKGITDANNMGAAMAPAAYDTLRALFRPPAPPRRTTTWWSPETWGLWAHESSRLLPPGRRGLTKNYRDCGMLLYDLQAQDMHAVASAAAAVPQYSTDTCACGMRHKWDRILFCPHRRPALAHLLLQGESIPGICHASALPAK